MLINKTDYGWSRGEIASISVTGEINHDFGQPVLLYAVTGTGNIKIYINDNIIYEGALPHDFSEPVACTALSFNSEAAEVNFIGMIGKRLWQINSYRSTGSGMTQVAGDVDDSVYTVPIGIDGFYFDGTKISNIYVSSNHYVGFGSNTEHLKIFRRDGRCSDIYSQTVLDAPIPFFKLRWRGYTVYSNQVTANRLIFELFLLANGDMVLYILQSPTTSGTYGTSSLTCNGVTTTLDTPANGYTDTIITFHRLDSVGKEWEIYYEDYGVNGDTPLYLMEVDGKYYRPGAEALEETPIESLTARAFVEYGGETKPASALLSENPHIFVWQPVQETPQLKWTATATPYVQELLCTADLSDSSITSIARIVPSYTGTVKISHKVQDAEWTEPIELADWAAQDCTALYSSIGEDRKLELKFYLHGGAVLKSLTISYTDEGVD
jgi:hypothetical protein